MITDDVFAQMVAEEVKNKLSPTQKKLLMQEENWDRWKRSLAALLDNLSDQVENIKADMASDQRRYASFGEDGEALAAAAQSAYDVRLNKINRFKFYVENRLAQVEGMIENKKPLETTPDEDIQFLRRAIVMHEKLMEKFDLEATSIDRALWATLDNRWEFDEVDASNL